MGGFFGAVSKRDIIEDVFFGTDYHSHLGTRRGGISAYKKEIGLQREIHNITNSPFRTKFEHIFEEMSGTSAIGCISDFDPQPLIIASGLGTYAICVVGIINNSKSLISEYLDATGGHFNAMTSGKINQTEIVASLINLKKSFKEGIEYVQQKVDGSATILILKDNGNIIAARDKMGRLPVFIGKDEDGFCISFESYVVKKLGYSIEKELGPSEIVELTPNIITQLKEPQEEMKICSFLWSYYGYPPATYENVNVEMMRYKNGAIMAEHDMEAGTTKNIDYIAGIPDSGVPHAIGYANKSGIPFARAFIKYTPTWSRSFMPTKQTERNEIAKMKQLPVSELIKGKSLLFVDDSLVRGTQIRGTVSFLKDNGVKEVHLRSACPPIMYGCKYLNFSSATSEMELIARRTIIELEGEKGLDYIDEYIDFSTERGKKLRESICKELNLATLEFQSLDGIIKAIGIEPCKLCTYCWNGKE